MAAMARARGPVGKDAGDPDDPNRPPPAGEITVDLLRRRAEHNEGMITTLEEVALHQQDIEKIELLDRVCRELKIIYLQNNLIMKIENLRRLKMLEYLNLALNNITKVENLQRCESLNKLDLTVNFIDKKGLLTIESLVHNEFLKDLYLLGNPGMDWRPGQLPAPENKGTGSEEARLYVIAVLPQVQRIDGKEVKPSERIKATQRFDDLLDALESELVDEGVDPEEVRAGIENQDDAESDDDDDVEIIDPDNPDRNGDEVKRPWSIKTRLKEHRELAAARNKHEKERAEDMRKVAEGEGMIGGRGRRQERREGFDPLPALDDVRQRNEPKLDYSLGESADGLAVVLDVEVGKFMDTSLVDVDVQPGFVRMLIKGKLLQLLLPEEVHPDQSKAQRSKATGHLVLTMPKVDPSRFGTGRGFYTNDQGPAHRAPVRGERSFGAAPAPALVTPAGATAVTRGGGGAVTIRGIVRPRADGGAEEAPIAPVKAAQAVVAGDSDDDDAVPDL